MSWWRLVECYFLLVAESEDAEWFLDAEYDARTTPNSLRMMPPLHRKLNPTLRWKGLVGDSEDVVSVVVVVAAVR